MRIQKFESWNKDPEAEIHSIVDDLELSSIEYKINSDLSVDFWGSVDLEKVWSLSYKGELPIKFGRVHGGFSVRGSNLSSLSGCPDEVGENFNCSDNNLENLLSGPKRVGANFLSTYCGLKSLGGFPEFVGGDIYLSHNELWDFQGIPEYSLNEGSEFFCNGNPIHSIYSLFNNINCIDEINELGVIRGKKVVWERLQEVFSILGKWVPENPDDLDGIWINPQRKSEFYECYELV
jgi:hypothetical protein